MQRAMRVQMTAALHAGESTQKIAERLLEIDSPKVELPRYVRELRDAARIAQTTGDRALLNSAIDRWRGTVEKLGEGPDKSHGAYTVRSAGQQLIADLQKSKRVSVDDAVDRWVLDRARYQARVIARTETANAFTETYILAQRDKPYVHGYRWTLSGRHPVPDVCDILANQNIDGLGPGGYRAENIPAIPHPSDLCAVVAIIDEQYFARELAKLKGEDEPDQPWATHGRETGEEWLQRQPQGFQRQLLGPTLAKQFLLGNKVLTDKGMVRPVHEVLGLSKPERRAGPVVQAKPLIDADRARIGGPLKSF